jgi:hypothetical protein
MPLLKVEVAAAEEGLLRRRRRLLEVVLLGRCVGVRR